MQPFTLTNICQRAHLGVVVKLIQLLIFIPYLKRDIFCV